MEGILPWSWCSLQKLLVGRDFIAGSTFFMWNRSIQVSSFSEVSLFPLETNHFISFSKYFIIEKVLQDCLCHVLSLHFTVVCAFSPSYLICLVFRPDILSVLQKRPLFTLLTFPGNLVSLFIAFFCLPCSRPCFSSAQVWFFVPLLTSDCDISVVSDSAPHGLWPASSSVHGILQAGTLEWVASPFSRGSSRPRDQTQISCTANIFLTVWASWAAV